VAVIAVLLPLLLRSGSTVMFAIITGRAKSECRSRPEYALMIDLDE
jgi:hypothetical protein